MTTNYYTPKELATKYNIPLDTVNGWIYRGKLQTITSSIHKKRRLIAKPQADNFIKEAQKWLKYSPRLKNNKAKVTQQPNQERIY